MSLTLSAAELARLEAALHTLLTPLDYDSIDTWRSAVSRRFRALHEADAALFVIPRPLVTNPVHSDEFSEAVRAQYETWFPLDGGAQRAMSAGMEATTTTHLVETTGTWEEYDRDPMINEFYRPVGSRDACGYLVSVPDLNAFASLELHRDRYGTELFGEKGRAILRLLLPAFKTGLHHLLRLNAHRTNIVQLIDQLDAALLVCDEAGHVLHQTMPLIHLLEQERNPRKVRATISQMVHSIRSRVRLRGKTSTAPDLPVCQQEIRTPNARYRLEATYSRDNLFASKPVIVLSVQRLDSSPLTDAELKEQFQLTPREIQVTRLLAQGQSNRDVARTLTISPHTAERHTERVLQKLGVTSRAGVATAIAGSDPKRP